MDRPTTLTLKGAHSSPYSRKMRAVLRYRHIAHDWVIRGSRWDDVPAGPVRVIPVLAWPDDQGGYREVMVDSSPQITRLEADHPTRRIEPTDHALAMLDFVLEDFADEWVTKAMYHYRWVNEADTEKSGRLLPLDANLQLPADHAAAAHDFIVERQVSRRALVGSTGQNAPIIEASYERTLDLLEAHLSAHDFFFGERPSRADFAMFGQLTPLLWWDPTPTAIAVDRSPRALMWVQWMDDLSWWRLPTEGDGWFDEPPSSTLAMLAEAGRTYVPFMVANAQALVAGSDEMVCEIDGSEYRQVPFGYQGKCLGWIRERYAALNDNDRTRVDALFEETSCLPLVRAELS